MCIFVKDSVSCCTEYSWNATKQNWHELEQHVTIVLTIKSTEVISNLKSWVLGTYDDSDTTTLNPKDKDSNSVK